MSKSDLPQYSPPVVAPPPGGSYPPPGGSYPQVISVAALGPNQQVIQCPSCHATVTTRVQVEASTKTHIIAVVLCCVSCCCCLPYLIDSCQDRNHYCPNCNAYIGKH